MPTTTEIISVDLVEGSDMHDPHNHTATTLNECFKVMAKYPGVQNIRYGTFVEAPNTLQLIIDWESPKHHEAFNADAANEPVRANFQTVVAGNFESRNIDFDDAQHTDLEPAASVRDVLDSPMAEIVSFYWTAGPAEDYLEGPPVFMAKAVGPAAGRLLGWAAGISHEELERDGVKSRVATVLLGWPSVEAHMECRALEPFKVNSDLLIRDAQAIEYHHVALTRYTDA